MKNVNLALARNIFLSPPQKGRYFYAFMDASGEES
jgi:hypothetical protein